MKAIVQDGYGAPDEVLRLAEIDRPEFAADEVLVRVQAAVINVGDRHMVRGEPYVMRPIFGRLMPKSGVVGTDFAGTVEAVGAAVTGFAAGDAVFGWGKGAVAEFAATGEDQLAAVPEGVTPVAAAALVTSVITALQGLRRLDIQPGQKVLVNGAAGGVGTFSVQIAKAMGGEVTAVCSAESAEMVRALGADHLIDYTQEDFTQGEARYDAIMDNVGTTRWGPAGRC